MWYFDPGSKSISDLKTGGFIPEYFSLQDNDVHILNDIYWYRVCLYVDVLRYMPGRWHYFMAAQGCVHYCKDRLTNGTMELAGHVTQMGETDRKLHRRYGRKK
jgi:hypothetical protein